MQIAGNKAARQQGKNLGVLVDLLCYAMLVAAAIIALVFGTAGTCGCSAKEIHIHLGEKITYEAAASEAQRHEGTEARSDDGKEIVIEVGK